MKKITILSISLFLSLLAIPQYVLATAIVLPATGGSAISADTVGGAYTSLTGPVISEGSNSDIKTGTIILNVPTGFIFDIGGVTPTVLLTRIGGTGVDNRNINGLPSGSTIAVTVTTTQLSITITSASSNGVTNSLTWQNVRVRPTAVTPLASGNIVKTGTSVIEGVTNNVTNFGTLTEVAIPTPTPASGGPVVGTINVVKVIINDNGRTKVINDFPLFVNGISVISGVTNLFPAPAPVYTISETGDLNYTRSFSGDCDFNGQLNLNPGQNKFCIVTNNDIGAGVTVQSVAPLIHVLRVPMPLSLSAGPGPVIYAYTLHNIGTVPVTNVSMMDDSCSPIELVSGDINNDSRIDVGETWMYACSTEIFETTVGTVTATGWANGISAVDIETSTVVVGIPALPDTGVIPPLIHVTKVPNPLALPAGGGTVIYTNTVTNPGLVALDYVYLTDDHCSPMKYISGDSNSDRRLDITETWTYVCQTNLTQTTTNTVVARGEANGLVAKDLAIVTIVVSANPNLPNTGFSSTLRQQVKSIIVNLSEGSRGTNVNILQKFLVSENKGPAARALGAHGTTFYFGLLTKAALLEWQKAVGIALPTGNFGPATRAYIGTYY